MHHTNNFHRLRVPQTPTRKTTHVTVTPPTLSHNPKPSTTAYHSDIPVHNYTPRHTPPRPQSHTPHQPSVLSPSLVFHKENREPNQKGDTWRGGVGRRPSLAPHCNINTILNFTAAFSLLPIRVRGETVLVTLFTLNTHVHTHTYMHARTAAMCKLSRAYTNILFRQTFKRCFLFL